ncbi:MAG: glycosyltransferase [Comamonadaceae bacterium]|nr:MAG: glycosyltransferase [Comamonadaceae bacterium]
MPTNHPAPPDAQHAAAESSPAVPRFLLSVIVPFLNEGEGVEAFARGMQPALEKLTGCDAEIICIDDGSTDDTLERLKQLAAHDPRYRVIELSRNFGKEAALTAGLDAATGDAVVPMDADLQDPPELLRELVEVWQTGVDVVLARRVDRRSDTVFKRTSANWFYLLHNCVSDIEIPPHVGDFRLMDRRVVTALKSMPERQRFMKGLFAWVGFRTAVIDYERAPRIVGSTKFPGWKLWNFALEGFTSFSTAPLRMWTYIGFCGVLFTSVYAIIILIRTLLHGVDVPGYASLLLAVLFFGSLQLVSVGLLGEYIGRIYIESKQRPVYIVRDRHGFPAPESERR